MKKRIIQLGVVIGLICVYLLFIQFNHLADSKPTFETKKGEPPTIYHLKKVVNVLKEHKIKLTLAKDINPDTFKLESVTPKIYTLDNNQKRNLFIYVFDKVSDRQKADQLFSEYSRDFFLSQYYRLGLYRTWNVLLVETVKQPFMQTDAAGLKPLDIDDIVFKKLNHGKVEHYIDETTHWEATYNLKYYVHQWVSADGKPLNDNDGRGVITLHYKPENKTEVSSLDYEFDMGREAGSATGESLDEKGNFTIYTYEKSEVLPKVTIRWNGQAETIDFNKS